MLKRDRRDYVEKQVHINLGDSPAAGGGYDLMIFDMTSILHKQLQIREH